MVSHQLAVPVAFVAAVLGAVAHVAPAATVRPVSTGDAPITWSVRPADEDGPDGRRVIDVVVEPGERTVEYVAVSNHSSVPVTFSITANDGYLTARGTFDMLPSDTPATGGGSWLGVPDEATVGAGESLVVPVEISVPEDAVPGDHPAGVAASVFSGGSEVAVESRVGVRVNLRVAGEAVAALGASISDVSYEPSWNPFAPGDLIVHYDVVNEGTVGLTAAARATARTILGGVDSAGGAEAGEVLPGGLAGHSVRLSGAWPLGPARIQLDVEPRLDEGASVAQAPATVNLSTTAWALPLPQLVLVLLVVLGVVGLRALVRRRRARLDRLLALARAEGVAAARAEIGRRAGEGEEDPTPAADAR